MRFCSLLVRSALISAVLSTGALAQKAAEEATPPKPLHFAAGRVFDMEHIKLNLGVNLEEKHVDAVATLWMQALEAASSVVLDAVDLNVAKVTVSINEQAAAKPVFANDGEQLEVFLGRTVKPGDRVIITVDYAVDDPELGLEFQAPDEQDRDAPYQVWSQGEAIENRYWIPCFDNPNEMQTSELIVTVDERNQVLSNGKLVDVSTADEEGKTTFHWSQEQPHASYLITMVVGQFAIEREMWRGKPVLYYAPPDRADEIKTTFGNTTRMLDFFSDALGVEYPWDKYAQVCCYSFGGGMENTSATTLGEGALQDERSRIDSDSDGLISHEMAHQWFGDLVTCKDWAHLWLNEGFASYFEALWDEHNQGADAFAVNMSDKARSAIRGGKDEPIVLRSYDNPDHQFDSRAYPKGAWVVHMLRRRLGDEMFWQALNLYLTENRHQPVETSDLRRAVERISGQNFERFFRDWTERPGHPEVTIDYSWNEKDGLAEIAIQQTQKDEAFHFPLRLELYGEGSSQPLVVTRDVSTKDEKLLLPMPGAPTMLIVDPRQEVLMDLTEKKGRGLWEVQLTQAANPVRRIEAADELAKKKTDATRELLATAFAREPFWEVRNAIAGKLGKLGGDVARDALLAGLQADNPKVRSACADALGEFADADDEDLDVAPVRAALAAVVTDGDESFRVESAAIAAYAKFEPDDLMAVIAPKLETETKGDTLRSAALRALGESDDPEVVELLLSWTTPQRETNTRSAAMAALASIAEREEFERDVADRIVEVASGALEGQGRWLRSRAAGLLGALGESAEAALPQLRELAADEGEGRFGRALKDAIKSIEEGQPPSEQLADLRKTLDELRDENKELRKRLEEVETKARALRELFEQSSPPSSGAAAAVSAP